MIILGIPVMLKGYNPPPSAVTVSGTIYSSYMAVVDNRFQK